MNNESIFIDKYRPQTLNDSIISTEIIEKIRLIEKYNMPHLLISGPKGCCKKTLVDLFLKEKYKNMVKNTYLVDIKTKTSKIIELKIFKSNYHIQLNPSSYGVYDRLIIHEFINEIIKLTKDSDENSYITIVIEDADKLTIDAQESLRRTIEEYIMNCRFIFIQTNTSSVIRALESRCIKISLNAISNNDIKKILIDISNKENININDQDINLILKLSDRNLKLAINYLNLYKNETKIVNIIDDTINSIIYDLNTNNSITELLKYFRENINFLLVHCIDPIDICKYIFNAVTDDMRKKNKYVEIQLVDEFTDCCDSLMKNNKPVYHIERFILYILLNFYLID